MIRTKNTLAEEIIITTTIKAVTIIKGVKVEAEHVETDLTTKEEEIITTEEETSLFGEIVG